MRITASRPDSLRLTVTASADLRPNLERRTLAGTVFRAGEVGYTSAGPLRIEDPAVLVFPDDLAAVALTREHDRGVVRGHLVILDSTPERMYAAFRVVDGPEGDAALAEAADRSRAGLSFDIEDTVVRDGVIVGGVVVAIGQVEDPAFNSARIDQIAASNHTPEGTTMTEQQRQRLAELAAKQNRTPEEEAELQQLQALAETDDAQAAADQGAQTTAPAATSPAAGTQVAASVPAVPGGVPTRQTRAQVRDRGDALNQFIRAVCGAVGPGGGGAQAITAALSNVTETAHGASIEAPAWSGELWSGVQHEPEFTPLLNSGDLTNWEGRGWRWVVKPILQDYAGDKAAVPSNLPTTEPSTYEASRMAAGWDLDRKFYDFPNEAFLRSFFEAAREDWSVKLDAKVEAYIIAEATANLSGVAPVAGNTLKSIGRLLRYVKRQKLGKGAFVILSDTDYDNLLDFTNDNLPAFLDLFGVDPKMFTSSSAVATDMAIAGVKQAATVRTLPGSPLRVDAQNIANGGVDSGLFGYWAIEEHHKTGIVSMDLGNVV